MNTGRQAAQITKDEQKYLVDVIGIWLERAAYLQKGEQTS